MEPLKTPKPATARHGEPVSKSEQLGSELATISIPDLTRRQALRLTRRFALSMPAALVVAFLYYGEGQR